MDWEHVIASESHSNSIFNSLDCTSDCKMYITSSHGHTWCYRSCISFAKRSRTSDSLPSFLSLTASHNMEKVEMIHHKQHACRLALPTSRTNKHIWITPAEAKMWACTVIQAPISTCKNKSYSPRFAQSEPKWVGNSRQLINDLHMLMWFLCVCVSVG